MPPPGKAYRIVKWNDYFENNRSRELAFTEWVPVPNKQDGSGYCELIDRPGDEGAAHFGAWVALVETASKCCPRGTLIKSNGDPHDARSLAFMSRLPCSLFEAVLPRLLHLCWIEEVDLGEARQVQVARTPQAGARQSRPNAGGGSLDTARIIRELMEKLTLGQPARGKGGGFPRFLAEVVDDVARGRIPLGTVQGFAGDAAADERARKVKSAIAVFRGCVRKYRIDHNLE